MPDARRLGRLLRPGHDGKVARFYTVVSRDTVDADFAQNRQRFLAEQGCDALQGHAVSEALDFEALQAWAAARAG